MKKRVIPGTICLLILVGVIFIFYSYTSGQGFAKNNVGFGNTNGNLANYGCIGKSGDWVYFAGYDDGYDANAFYRVKADGSKRERLFDKVPSYINIYGGFVFFTSSWESGALYRMNENGSNLINLGVSCSTMNVVDGTIYYVGGDTKDKTDYTLSEDQTSLYKMDLNGKKKKLLFTENYGIHNVNISDGYIYYISSEGPAEVAEKKDKYLQVHRRTLDGKNKETIVNRKTKMFVVDGKWVYYVDINDGSIYKILSDGKGEEILLELKESKQDFNATYMSINIDDNKLYVKDTRKFYTMDFDGKNKKTVFSGKDYRTFFTVFDGSIYYDENFFESASYALDLKTDKKIKLDDTYINILKVDDEYIYYDNMFDGENWYEKEAASVFKVKHNGEGRVKIAERECSLAKLRGYDLYFFEGQDLVWLSLKSGKKTKIATLDKGFSIVILQIDNDGYVYYTSFADKISALHKVSGDGSSKAQLIKKVDRTDYSGTDNMAVMDGWVYYTDKIPGIDPASQAIYKMKSDGTAVQMLKGSHEWIFTKDEEVHENQYGYCENLEANADGYIYYTINNGDSCGCGPNTYYRIKGDGTGKERLGADYLSTKYGYKYGGWDYYVRDTGGGERSLGDGNIVKVKGKDTKIIEYSNEANINLYGDTLFYSYKREYSDIIKYAAK